MQALTVPNVRSAMVAVLKDRTLTMAKLFAAVMQKLDVSEDDDENRRITKDTVALLLDGHIFVFLDDKSGKERISLRRLPTLPNVRSAMIAVLKQRDLTIVDLFTQVLQHLGVSPDDKDDRHVVEYTVTYLLDGHRFDIILGKSGKEKIKYCPLAPSVKRRKK